MKIGAGVLVSLRKISVILYMVQFSLIWLYNGYCDKYLADSSVAYCILHFSLIRYVIVVFVALIIAELLLTLEKYPHFSYLKYLH